MVTKAVELSMAAGTWPRIIAHTVVVGMIAILIISIGSVVRWAAILSHDTSYNHKQYQTAGNRPHGNRTRNSD